MTGHGRGEARTKAWTAVVECFSVNRKTAEVVFHSERGAAWLDPVVRAHVMSVIARGRVQVNLTLARTDGSSGHLLDGVRAAAYLREARALQKTLGVPGEIGIADVLSAPGVAGSAEPSGDGAKEAVLAALDAALRGLVATRRREGESLRRILAKGAQRLAGIVKKITPFARRASASQRKSLLRRIARSGLARSPDDPRLLTEVALLAERGDITEELDRAASHLDQFQKKLSADGPVGRTLEFLAQELGREFNTLGSKASDLAISRLVIEAKTGLDRLREQLANIE